MSKLSPENQTPYLYRASTIKLLWRIFIGILAATIIAQLFIPVTGYFGVDGWFAFGAIFGFLSCAAMVFAAKALGIILKRKDDYYDR